MLPSEQTMKKASYQTDLQFHLEFDFYVDVFNTASTTHTI